MMRAAIWMIGIAVLIAAAVWLVERPGSVTLTWQGWRVDTSVAFLMFCVAVIAAAAALGYRLFLFIRRAPRHYAASRQAARRDRGYRALTRGMVAVAAGDAGEAGRHARRADNLLNDPPLTMLLSAQAAQLAGDDAAARTYFFAMLERAETAFLGLRGLLIQAQREGDEAAALDYARRAYELRPKTPWVLTTLFELQVKEGDWRGALATLDEAVRRKAIEAAEARRRKVVVLLGCSGEAEAAGDRRAALSHARKAYDQANEFLPGVVRLVALMVADDRTRPASRIILNAWAREPHPELARIYAEIGPDEPLKKFRRIERLRAANPDHRESNIALAEAALEAELWGTARNHLEQIADGPQSARVCRMMAELEETEHGDSAAGRKWLLRAASAEADPAWTCNDCGTVSADWGPLCPKCGALGSLSWSAPERTRGLVLRAPAPAAPQAETATDRNGGETRTTNDATAAADGAADGDNAAAAVGRRLIDVDEPAHGR